MVCAALALACLAPPVAAADPVVLRYASMAPDGTAWARELKAYARDVQARSDGQVRIKMYYGGIAGDESAVPARIHKGQLDGEMAAVTCERMGPSLRVLRVPGLIRSRQEAQYVIDRLRPVLETEFRRAGFALLGLTWFGSDIIFSRQPVRTLDDLRRMRFWIWNLDQVWSAEMTRLGLHVVPLSLDEAGPAYDAGRIDGFLALPSAALVYQWSARSRYFTRLPIAAMAACNFVANGTFDALPIATQTLLRDAAAKLNFRFADVAAAQHEALLGGLFARQGVRPVPVTELFRVSFLEAARQAREALPATLVPPALLAEVQGWLSDFRATAR
jgi:TRAP-type C4-dicarboxylate transport system substrate-binding protein